jgi:hypothetical protein
VKKNKCIYGDDAKPVDGEDAPKHLHFAPAAFHLQQVNKCAVAIHQSLQSHIARGGLELGARADFSSRTCFVEGRIGFSQFLAYRTDG